MFMNVTGSSHPKLKEKDLRAIGTLKGKSPLTSGLAFHQHYIHSRLRKTSQLDAEQGRGQSFRGTTAVRPEAPGAQQQLERPVE